MATAIGLADDPELDLAHVEDVLATRRMRRMRGHPDAPAWTDEERGVVLRFRAALIADLVAVDAILVDPAHPSWVVPQFAGRRGTVQVGVRSAGCSSPAVNEAGRPWACPILRWAPNRQRRTPNRVAPPASGEPGAAPAATGSYRASPAWPTPYT